MRKDLDRALVRAVGLFGAAVCGFVALAGTAACVRAADALPYPYKFETYRDKNGDVMAFALRLEQPFLAEEFERSNYLRLQPLDQNAYLVYPKETKFQQKHAEFYGRLRGQGTAKLRLSYEIVSENPDGSRKVDVRQADCEVKLPDAAAGPESIYRSWAMEQTHYYRRLLEHYPDETFFQYLLLQSPQRYGVTVAAPPAPRRPQAEVESDLFGFTSGAISLQSSLQRETLSSGRLEDLTIPVEQLTAPNLKSPDYKQLLAARLVAKRGEPRPAEIARLIPDDQYFIQFASMKTVNEWLDLANDWLAPLLRITTNLAVDHRLIDKVEAQLGVQRTDLEKLFASGALSEVALTGADPFMFEGTDVSLIFRVRQPEPWAKALATWRAAVKVRHPNVKEQEFTYRGHKFTALFTDDRSLSSFLVEHEGYAVVSTSHRAARRAVEAALGLIPRLYDADDYRYMTTLLPAAAGAENGYLFASEAFLRRLHAPAAKVSEKRRLQCYANLVTLNNAALFYRLEYGKSPASLNDLVEGRFVDPRKVACPHGGAYAYDGGTDACTCSLHNRLKYLTPNVELNVQKVSATEQQAYNRYRASFEQEWGSYFSPIAARLTMGPKVKVETCCVPFANGEVYRTLRQSLVEQPVALDTSRLAPSALASVLAAPGKKKVGEQLRNFPGVAAVLDADPTLSDLSWVGERVALHMCDGDGVIEFDPTQLKDMNLPLLGKTPASMQAYVAGILRLASAPAYLTIDVEDREKAARLLDQMGGRVFLSGSDLLGQGVKYDAVRLPDYKQHKIYAYGMQWYAFKVRLHVALVNQQLVAATKPELLNQVIDAAANVTPADAPQGQLMVRLNAKALKRSYPDLKGYWDDHTREACHKNAISTYNLVRLYETPVPQAPKLAEAKYGVRYFCPEHGVFEYDTGLDQLRCTVHGNREESRQTPAKGAKASFDEFMGRWEELTSTLRVSDDAVYTTTELVRPR